MTVKKVSSAYATDMAFVYEMIGQSTPIVQNFRKFGQFLNRAVINRLIASNTASDLGKVALLSCSIILMTSSSRYQTEMTWTLFT